MCNLSKGVMEKGIAKGMELGLTQSALSHIKGLMETMMISAEQAMAAMKIPDGERPKYRTLLEKQ